MDTSSDTTRNDGEHQIQAGSDEDVKDLVERLRSTPADELIADLFATLLSSAQVKLGRRDARLFIDLCALTLEYARSYLSADGVKRVETALGQLRLAQVSAENEAAKKGRPEPNDLTQIPAPPRTGVPAEAGSLDQSAPTSKLWVPGR